MFRVLKKNPIFETVLFSAHNICFGWKIRKLNFWVQSLWLAHQYPHLNSVCPPPIPPPPPTPWDLVSVVFLEATLQFIVNQSQLL